MKSRGLKKLCWLSLTALSVLILSNCSTIQAPDVPVCKELDPQSAHCAWTISKKTQEVNDQNKYEDKTWWEHRPYVLSLFPSTWEKIKTTMTKICAQHQDSCKANDVDQIIQRMDEVASYKKPEVTKPIETPTKPSVFVLSWDHKPELKPSSNAILSLLTKDVDIYSKASDMKKICPKWDGLSKDQKTVALAEFWISMAVYESSWNPKSQSVDVGKPDQKDTWSVGLWQMSVVDQKNYGFDFGYKFADLITPVPNATLAFAVMKRQITLRGKILIPKGEAGLYWAVIHPGGKYDKTDKIIERTQSKAAFCK